MVFKLFFYLNLSNHSLKDNLVFLNLEFEILKFFVEEIKQHANQSIYYSYKIVK